MITTAVRAQEVDYDSLLQRIDTVENPVYKPVISFSYGVMNFRGDVRSSLISPVSGNQAGRINVATYIGKKHYYIANFAFMLGKLTANEFSHTEPDRNLNFPTDLYSIGLNLEYRFGHLIDKSFAIVLRRLRIEKGLSQEQFGFEANLHRTYISQLERGLKSPSLKTLSKIAVVLGISLTELMALVEQESNVPFNQY